METPQQRIDAITEELRDLYKNTNEGPRLIAEMIEREFPHPRRVWNDPRRVWNDPHSYGDGGKSGWGMLATAAK